jgi:hypothetical protein
VANAASAQWGKRMPILVRLQPALLASLDAWISKQDILTIRPEAIRRLLELALGIKGRKPNTTAK